MSDFALDDQEKEPETEAAEVVEETTQPETAEKVEPESPETTEETKAESDDETPEKPDSAPIAVIQAERSKAQAARQEADELRQQLSQALALAQQSQPKAEPEKPQEIDPNLAIDDPAEFLRQVQAQQRAEMQQMQSGFREQINNIHEANAIARHGKDKFLAAVESFKAGLQNDPSLLDRMNKASDPAEFVFQVGNTQKELADVNGDLGAFREKVRAELLAEQKAEAEKKAAKLEAIPDAMSAQTSPANIPTTDTGTEPDLSKILALG